MNLATDRTRHKPLPVRWMGVAFAISVGLAGAALVFGGTDSKSIVIALQLTARWSFLLFWVAYTGRALATLFGPALAPLARRGREFGLAYAAAMTVHFGLVVWLFQISSKPPLSGNLFVFFVIGLVFTYLLVISSLGRVAQTLGSNAWRVLRTAGLNYILMAFAFDFVNVVIHAWVWHIGIRGWIIYGPFAALSVAAPLLVLVAAAPARLGMKYRPARLGSVVE
jgi:hypothetical protein